MAGSSKFGIPEGPNAASIGATSKGSPADSPTAPPSPDGPIMIFLPGEGGVEGVPAEDILKLSSTDTWGNGQTLEKHFLDHGSDFGATSAEDYAQQASEFLQRSQREGLPTKIGPDGTIRVYDPDTNTFGSYNPDGTTRTFYKPNPATHEQLTNLDYWNGQPGGPPDYPGQ